MNTPKKVLHSLPKKQPAESTADVFRTPPPAKPTPGVSGNPPLPPGGIIQATSGYTDAELAQLNQIPGWSPADGVPANMPEILAQVAAAQEQADRDMDPANIAPPIDPSTPPLQPPRIIDIAKLPAAERERILGEIEAAKSQQAMWAKQAADMPQAMAPGASGVAEAIAGHNVREITLDDDLDDDKYAGTDTPKTSSPKPSVQKQGRTGATAPLITNCPHCHWQLDQPDIPDPDDKDRQRFLQSTLGLQTFRKSYKLLGGKLNIVLRELTPTEIDLCYKQSHLDRRNGLLDGAEDFFEALQRYRMCLQLVEIRSAEAEHKFPDTVEGWAGGEPLATTKATILLQIYQKLYADVITTESLNRLLGNQLSRFNRLLSKLEVNADNPDFWSETTQAP